MLSAPLIDRVLDALPGRRVGLIGDLFLDRYLDIDATLTEPSIETGLDAYQIVRVRSYPGAIGTVINNLAALGVGTIRPLSIVGDDGEGYELRQQLAKLPCVDAETIVSWPGRRTPTYTKPMLMKPGESPRELHRLDIKNRTSAPTIADDAMARLLEELWTDVDAWIVVDQVSEANCGVITRRVRQRITELASADSKRFVLADSRARIREFRSVCVKPNQNEAAAYPGGPAAFAKLLGCHVFQTLGEQGIDLFAPSGNQTRVPAYPVQGPIDIVGAGDSTSAGITAAIVAGASFVEAAAFGNLVASITIQQLGVTGTATPTQVRERWQQVRPQ